MWADITSEYDVSDAAGIQLLAIACQALDRAETLRAIIDKEGVMIQNKQGNTREHPALKQELNNRCFVVRTLSRLGLSFEPMQANRGRTGGKNSGWDGVYEK
jgi:hypothetical protein